MSTARSALIVANYEFQDPGLRQLRAPAHDAEALAEVLADPEIGDFEVDTLLNQPSYEVDRAIERFFRGARKDDLLLLHFSGHGVKDETGDLYFAVADTDLGLLGSTAVASESVNRWMNRSRARRAVLLLDCCYAGAFERGMASKSDAALHLPERLGGRGRAVITASTAMEYAFEGKDLSGGSGAQPSVFTSALVEGLRTGAADTDQDGAVGLDELYDYVYEKVRSATPNQTPSKWALGFEGELVIARRSTPVGPAPLPAPLIDAIESPFASVRVGAVHELERMLGGSHIGRALAARMSLERLTDDDSRMVGDAAVAALAASVRTPDPDDVVVPGPPSDERTGADERAGTDHESGLAEGGGTVPTGGDDGAVPSDGELVTVPVSGDGQGGPPESPEPDGQGEPPESPEPDRHGEPPQPSGSDRQVQPPGPGRSHVDVRRPPDWLTGRTGVLVAAASVLAVLAVVLAVVLTPGGDDPSDTAADGRPNAPEAAALPEHSLVGTARVDGEVGLFEVDSETGESRRIPTKGPPELPTIAPDRTWLVYLTRDTPGATATPRRIGADGTGDRPLFDSSSGCRRSTRPAWNATGDRMAFLCSDGDVRQLFLADGDGRNGEPHDVDGELTGAPTWGLHGGTVGIFYEVVESRDPSRMSLWWVDASGGDPHRVPEGASDEWSYTHPDYGDGRLLFLQKTPGREEGALMVMPDGGAPAKVTDGVKAPAWSPDGTRIAFLKDGRLWITSEENPDGEPLDLGGVTPLSSAWGSR